MADALAAVATGQASDRDRSAVNSAVSDLSSIAQGAAQPLSARLKTTVTAIRALEQARPTRGALNGLSAAFADLDDTVRAQCHFPLH